MSSRDFENQSSKRKYEENKDFENQSLNQGLKRKHEANLDSNKSIKVTKTSTPNSRIVADHYNKKPDVGVEKRNESTILFLKNFNNWIKSVIIGKHVEPNSDILDMGCGKGGDLLKWKAAKISTLVGLDLSDVSIEDAKKRWENIRGGKHPAGFHAEFHVLDCFSNPITSIASIKNKLFDVVSMQFCLHYSFETENKARMALKNASSNLKEGGLFIGTVTDANWIVKKLKTLDPKALEFGNSIYSIVFEQKHEFPTFGHKYRFNLEDAINDCPEYLVHFPTFEKMAREYGLELIYKKRFHDIYNESKEDLQYRELLYKMSVIKRKEPIEMSDAEWEAAGIYIGFAFKKVRT
ncbi:16827_t:CDS:2 [Dentiscutata erythropus]|uniref:mRNA cap guanine-N(7) methyltransferase n=1 Tax=Dentiscutata erythropus TaxID=1348616 RepID=A0A9N9EAM0_9GLOM|nr:16827_t:CDS:2 [Dentiscutata erythropus]